MTRVLAAAFLAAALAGCQTVGSPTVPPSLLTCAGEPAWRMGGTQRDVAAYASDLRDARADCSDRLDAVRSIVEPKQ